MYLPTSSTVLRVDDGFLSAGTFYYHGDALGSARMMTDPGGNMAWSGEFLPFGQEWNAEAGVNHYKFTGQERDAETGLDYFEARHYTSQYGRFMQPDPAGMAAVDPTNPQSWNRYAYVLGNPVNWNDPTGMCPNGLVCSPPPPNENCELDGVASTCDQVDELLDTGAAGLCNASGCYTANLALSGPNGTLLELVTYDPEAESSAASGYFDPYGPNAGYHITQDAFQPITVGALFVSAPPTMNQRNWWKTFLKTLLSVQNVVQSEKQAYRNGYFACVASGGDAKSATRAALGQVAEKTAEQAAKQAAPFAAGAWYHFTDARFTAWGTSSKVLVPQAAEKIAGAVDVAGWIWTDFDLAKGIATCSPF